MNVHKFTFAITQHHMHVFDSSTEVDLFCGFSKEKKTKTKLKMIGLDRKVDGDESKGEFISENISLVCTENSRFHALFTCCSNGRNHKT